MAGAGFLPISRSSSLATNGMVARIFHLTVIYMSELTMPQPPNAPHRPLIFLASAAVDQHLLPGILSA